MNIYVTTYNKKKPEDIISGIFLFSFFILSWIPINIVCMVKKYNKWEEIRHTRKVKINELASDKE